MSWRSSPARSRATTLHVFLCYRPHQDISQIVQWLKGISSWIFLQEFPVLRKKFWGRHFWVREYSGSKLWDNHRRDGQRIHR
ncbi:MAG: transposase [Gammaproteobacteria bacterium]